MHYAATMKKQITRKLALGITTIRQLDLVVGGASRPRTYGCPSVDTVSCLPPKSDGCFTEVGCPTLTQ